MKQEQIEEIHIVLCCDDNYIKYATTTIFSIVNTAAIHDGFAYNPNNVHYLERVSWYEIFSGHFKELQSFSFVYNAQKYGGGGHYLHT
ncbi:hypothetical protein CQA66_01265 [Helicobacter aurati]|uniref:Uncharacterized protein n=1 Tax=Helicobacter aurati TaxID=137778 RepID=A0A3D8J751_9HELI|nr:hypothetical protein [Helicobacter aurati]RDU73327.1 hypothetical protein CQA66_01265 [Helicobacter aurati]